LVLVITDRSVELAEVWLKCRACYLHSPTSATVYRQSRAGTHQMENYWQFL